MCTLVSPKYSSVIKGATHRFPLDGRSLVAIVTLAAYTRGAYPFARAYVSFCVCVCVCGHERELLKQPPPSVRTSAPEHNMGKHMWDPRLSVDDQQERSTNFEHHKRELSITAKVGTVGLYMF